MIVAPVNGVVTNLELRPGNYLSAGVQALAMVDSDSVHVDGYFEETKLPRIRVGDRVSVRLMGESQLIYGHVESIASAIFDRERTPMGDLVANVNPTFSWVRLAQRVPVRISLDPGEIDVRLIAGRTATVVDLSFESPRPRWWSASGDATSPHREMGCAGRVPDRSRRLQDGRTRLSRSTVLLGRQFDSGQPSLPRGVRCRLLPGTSAQRLVAPVRFGASR